LADSCDMICQAPTSWWHLCQSCWGWDATSRRECRFPGPWLPLLWSYRSSCDQSRSLKLGSTVFLPIMVTLAMSAAAALRPVMSFSSRLAWCKVSLPAGSYSVRVARGRGRYLPCGAGARLAPFPLQRLARISFGTFL